MKTVINFILIFIALSSTIYGQTDRQRDSLALVDLYNNTNGGSWTDRTNWLTSNPIDTWFGITVEGDRVTQISMYKNNLDGTIPASIGNLSALTYLKIGYDNLTGTIPEEIYDLTSLTFFEISNSQIEGNITSSISKLINLNNLRLYGNRLSGALPAALGSLSELVSIVLSMNQFSGQIPEEIGNLTKLTSISLYTNQFVGSIPSTIGDLTLLTSLNLYNNNLSGVLPQELSNLAALSYINLNNNQFSGLVSLENLTNLSSIYIKYNQFDNLTDLSALTSIAHLHINNNNFTFEDIEPNIGLADFLYSPQDSVGAIKDTVIETHQSLALNISVGGENNRYQWFKDETSISTVSAWPLHILPSISMDDAGSYVCKITNTIAQNLTLYSHPLTVSVVPSGRDRDSLALVDLYNSTNGANWTNHFNWLTDKPIDTWNGVNVTDDRVSSMFLYNNNLSGPLPVSIGDLSGLKTLNLYGNSLTGNIPAELMNLSQLTGLFLFSNNFSGPIPTEIGNLTQLTSLMLSNNSLSGPIPAEIGILTSLTGMNLSSNQLTGAIPASFGNLINMQTLSLNANNLTGTIPSGIGNMTQMTELYLRGNSFSGEIPVTFSNLVNLSNFEISYNNLSGPIPTGFSSLSKLTGMWIHSNAFTDLPDLSSISGLANLTVQNNQLTFKDVVPNINITGFVYAPQDSVGEAIDTSVTLGSELILSVNVGGSASQYQWIKNGGDIAGALGDTYVIDSFSAEDAGIYNCKITNTIATQLTLYSRSAIIKEFVIPADTLSVVDIQYVDNAEQNDSSRFAGHKVAVKGLVMNNPRDIYLGARWGVFIADPIKPTDPWAGMLVVQNDTINTITNFENVKVGDIVYFTGIVYEYRGFTELILDNGSTEAVNIISTGNSFPEPQLLTCNDLLPTKGGEQWEGVFIKVNSATVSDTSNAFNQLPIHDSSGGQCYLDDYFLWFRENIYNSSYQWPEVDTNLNVSGFFKEVVDNEGNSIYSIAPRDTFDLQIIPEGSENNYLTFQVNMSEKIQDNTFQLSNGHEVVLRGDFRQDGWTLNDLVLSDPEQDEIYTITTLVAGASGDTIEYKYAVNTDGEDIWESDIANREYILSGQPETLPVVYFNDEGPEDFEKIIDGDMVLDAGDSRGVVWADFNNDGFIDLFVANRNEEVNFYYKNVGGSFVKQTGGAFVTKVAFSFGATAGDYNNDGDLDIFVTNGNDLNNELWENDGAGNFTLITTGEIVNTPSSSFGSSWGDLDNDGFLDLYVANAQSQKNFLYKNNQDGSFTAVTNKPPVIPSFESLSVSLVDTDNDGDLDIFVTDLDEEKGNNLYINNGGMEFTDLGSAFSNDKFTTRSSCWADFDNDGDLDLFVTISGQPNMLYRNDNNNHFVKISSGVVVSDIEFSRGCVVEDFDNDGLIDIYIANTGTSNSYYKNKGNFNFDKITGGTLVADEAASIGVACADFNNDGFTDIFVGNAGGENNALYKNNGNDNSWLKVKCQGTKSNRSAIGAKVFVNANSIWQMRQINAQTGTLSQSGLIARFGLAEAALVDEMRIEWPSGTIWDTTNVDVNQLLEIKEPMPQEENDPFLATLPAENITASGALIRGIVSTKGISVTKVSFIYGTTSSYGNTVNAIPNWVSYLDSVSVSAGLTDLSADTKYYYRLEALLSDDRTIQGIEQTFTTLNAGGGSAPVAVTGNAQNISVRNAELYGTVNPNGIETQVSFAYSTTNAMIPSTVINPEESTLYGDDEVATQVVISGLDPETTYYYRILASNSFGQSLGNVQSFVTESYEQNIVIAHNVSFPDKNKSEYTAGDFRLLGLPGNTMMPVSQLLSGSPGEEWIAYWDNGRDQDFIVKHDGSSIFQFTTGRAFWVLNKGIVDINTQITNLPLNANSEVSIPLHDGWNIITNPFNVTVSWSDVKSAESNKEITLGDLWQFEGSFNVSGVLEPTKGYYAFIQAASLNIPYPPRSSGKKAAPPAKKAKDGWNMNITLNSMKYVDQSTYLGVSPRAKKGFDGLDSRKPRAVGDIINICFERPEWDLKSASFARDIRPEFSEIERWNFTVNAKNGSMAELSFKGITHIPQEFSVYLIDKSRSVYRNLRENETYDYRPVLKTEQFMVVVGKDELMEGELAAIMPMEFKVENNFPNPFNPETTIPLQIPVASNIKVEIFNILGEKITTLFQGELAPGRHLLTWRAGNMPTGIYFHRITSSANREVLIGKMILMK